MSIDPYNNSQIVKIYEERYNTDSRVKFEILYEIDVVRKTLIESKHSSWCDVACGTGFHLRNLDTSVFLEDLKKVGLDKSSLMIDTYKQPEDNTEFIVADLLDYQVKETYDLTTNFWFGYSHQPSLKDVMKFFDKMVELTSINGSMILSIHNQWGMFNQYPYHFSEPMGGDFKFEAMVWSYCEPGFPEAIYNCIVPHRDLIKEHLLKHFESVSITSYPPQSGPGGKELVIAKGRMNE